MTKEFINPNFHVILIHAPLGLLIFGTVMELLSFLWPKSSARSAGRWMILLGILAGAPAALGGLYAMWDVNAPNEVGNEMTWAQVRAESPVQGKAWEMLQDHAWLNGGAAACLLVLMTVWLAFSDAWRRRLHVLFLALLVGLVMSVVIGAWHGGEMIYREGVAVTTSHAAETDGTEAAEEPPTTAAAELTSQEKFQEKFNKFAYFFPPLQMHVMSAGAAIAIAFAALGLSLRGNTKIIVDTQPAMDIDMGSIAGAFDPRPAGLRREAFEGPREVIVRSKAARWWLLMSFVSLLTVVGGGVVLANFSEAWDLQHLVDLVRDRPEDGPPLTRRMAHVILGTALVSLPLLLALLARFASKQRMLIGVVGLILLAAASAQVWIGTLMMLDTPFGTVRTFNGAEGDSATTAPTTQEVE